MAYSAKNVRQELSKRLVSASESTTNLSLPVLEPRFSGHTSASSTSTLPVSSSSCVSLPVLSTASVTRQCSSVSTCSPVTRQCSSLRDLLGGWQWAMYEMSQEAGSDTPPVSTNPSSRARFGR